MHVLQPRNASQQKSRGEAAAVSQEAQGHGVWREVGSWIPFRILERIEKALIASGRNSLKERKDIRI